MKILLPEKPLTPCVKLFIIIALKVSSEIREVDVVDAGEVGIGINSCRKTDVMIGPFPSNAPIC